MIYEQFGTQMYVNARQYIPSPIYRVIVVVMLSFCQYGNTSHVNKFSKTQYFRLNHRTFCTFVTLLYLCYAYVASNIAQYLVAVTIIFVSCPNKQHKLEHHKLFMT